MRAPNDRLGNGVKAGLDDFVARNPGRVTIEVGESGAALAMEKIKTALAGGTPPDLYGGLFQSQAAELLLIGGVVDLNAELKGNREWGRVRGELSPAVVEGCSWKGKLPFLPMMLATQLRGFNRQMLSRAGVPLPATGYTWNDFLEIGRKTAAPPDVALFHFQYDWSEFGRWLYSNGQRVLSPDRTKAQYDTTVGLETLQFLHDQVTRGMARAGALNFQHFNVGASVTDSINEAAAMQPPRYPDVDPGDGSGIYATHYAFGPSHASKQLIQSGNAYGLVVLKTADPRKVAAAAQVAAWSARADVQSKVADASGHPPPNSVAARDENLPRRIKDNPILKTINDVCKFMYLTPNSPSWTQGMTDLTANLQRVWKGELRPKDALADAQPRIQALLDEDLRRG
jgi:ABC-type glycerol-3-phosphate transport system substrate-binding protein